ncbi:hypothetical protein MRX96_057770 [Rhipicephalus microplus]
MTANKIPLQFKEPQPCKLPPQFQPLVFFEASETPEAAAVDEAATVNEIVAVDEENCTSECVLVAILFAPIVPEGFVFALNDGVDFGLLPAPWLLMSRRATEGSPDESQWSLDWLLERLWPAEFPLDLCRLPMGYYPARLTSVVPSAGRHAGAGSPVWSPLSPSVCRPLLLLSLEAISALVEIGGTRWAFRVGKEVTL